MNKQQQPAFGIMYTKIRQLRFIHTCLFIHILNMFECAYTSVPYNATRYNAVLVITRPGLGSHMVIFI